MKKVPSRLLLALLSGLACSSVHLRAQAAANPTPDSSKNENEEETVVLSPFVVTAEEDTGYLANATAVGGRVRTELKDIASAISVVTQQFLTDTKAKDNQTLLQYTTNTEIGGIYGNFAGVGNTYTRGAGESALNMLRPNGNTRVRGLDSADNTRDLVKTDIPWNGFNVGRVDFQRGPNSILFGLGSPAGIINASTNTANVVKSSGSVENQIGSFGSIRNTLDYNYVLIPKTLAIRLDAVLDDQKYRQKPAFNRNRTIFTALRWDPKLFGEDSTAHTTIRLNYEKGDVKANRPHSLPPGDRITPFFAADKLNKRLIDVAVDYQTGLYPWKSGTAAGAPYLQQANNWVSSGAFGGLNPQFFYDNNSTPIRASAGSIDSWYAPNHSGPGFPFSVPAGVADFGEYASNVVRYGQQNGLPQSLIDQYAGADKGFWKGLSITDPSIYDFYNNLIHGPTKKEWQRWEAYNVTLEQSFLEDRVGFQAIYDRQSYEDGGQSILGWNPSITIDNNLYTTDAPSAYSQARLNPNVGRAYVSGTGSGQGRWTDRENVILTGFGELRAVDFLDSTSLLSRILGRHVVTGVYHEERYNVEDRSWALYAATGAYSDLVGTGYNQSYDGQFGRKTGGLKNDTPINTTFYLSPNIAYKDGKNLNLTPIQYDVAPPGSFPIRYYDAHWKPSTDPTHPDYVDPKAPYTVLGVTSGMGVPETGDQSKNPDNYVGWVTATVPILNADKGDINQLYRSGSKVQKKTTSKGGTWQAYLWDDTIVATVGYRKDRQETRTGTALPDPTGIAQVNSYGLAPLNSTGIDEGSSLSWGVVARLPKSLRGKLPWGTDVSVGYSKGKNTRVENRYGFNAKRLPNTKGDTEDISLSVSMLDERLNFKVTHYDTYDKDANISTVGGQNATLGSGTGWVYQIESRGTLSALVDLAGLNGDPQTAGWEWYWNWASMTGGFSKYGLGDFDPKTDAEFLANPETIKEKAAIASWLEQMQPQEWFDLYGIDINVAKAKAGDYNNAVRGGQWRPSNYINIGDNGGTINGEYPTGTVDTRSTGWEFEVTGRPIKNLDISLNASKQFARQVKLGDDLVQFMEAAYKKFNSPAGDLRLWWGGDQSFKNVFMNEIWSGYQFQAQTNGKLVNEMSPWRANLSGTYRFDRGVLKGGYVGGSYRWQQGTIIGYGMNAKKDNLDVNRPYWSEAEDWVDLWAGYEFKLTNKINWRTQINLRSVGDKPHLKVISVQPDGSAAGYRIEEGMTWLFSNTLSF